MTSAGASLVLGLPTLIILLLLVVARCSLGCLSDIVYSFVSFVAGDCCPIKTSCRQTDVRERLLLAKSSLVQQVVSRCDIVVTIGLDALHGVVGVETELVKNLLVDCVFERHDFLTWK